MADLRDYQSDALTNIKQAVREGARRLMLQMPTGGGKTRIAAEIVNGAHGKNKRIVFTVPAIELIDQTVDAFAAEGIEDVGVIQADHRMTDWGKPIQIASVQTLMRADAPPRADVVIQDEAHKLFKYMLRWMTDMAWRNVPFIGLSATPWTKGLGRVYERLIVGSTTQGLIDKKVLSPFRVLAPSHPDLTGVRTAAGDYVESELSAAMQRNQLTADIVRTWQTRAEGRPTICFAVDRAHALHLKTRFEQAGVPAAYMDCKTPGWERRDIRKQFLAGAVKVVCNVEVIGIGVDWPEVACISYCRPTKSEIRFVQNIGRGLRVAPGKKDLLILDHSDTHLRMGFVTDIHHEHLLGGKERPEQPTQVRLPKECKACGFLRPYGALVCPQCGHKQPPPPPRAEFTNAELAEFNGKKTRGKKERFTTVDKRIFLAELKAYGIEKGYRDGWASNQYRQRFDVWPGHGVSDVPPAAAISAATRQWIKSRQIAWAKSKRRNGDGDGVGYAANGARHPGGAGVCGAGDHVEAGGTGPRGVGAAKGEVVIPFVPGTLCTPQDLEDFE